MKEYIERSAILDTLADPFRKASDETEVEILKCWDRIKKIPAADVVPVRHGRWAQHYVGQERTPWGSDCSVCGEWLVIDRLVMQEKYHYCPNCGAKMDGGADK